MYQPGEEFSEQKAVGHCPRLKSLNDDVYHFFLSCEGEQKRKTRSAAALTNN